MNINVINYLFLKQTHVPLAEEWKRKYLMVMTADAPVEKAEAKTKAPPKLVTIVILDGHGEPMPMHTFQVEPGITLAEARQQALDQGSPELLHEATVDGARTEDLSRTITEEDNVVEFPDP